MSFPKISFKEFKEKIIYAVIRFPLTFVSIIILASTLILKIINNDLNNFTQLATFGFLSILLTLSFYLFAEDRYKKILTSAINLILMALLLLICSTFPNDLPEAFFSQFYILMLSFAICILFSAFIFDKNSLKWWNYLLKTIYLIIISGFFSAVIMVGLSLAVISLDKLFLVKIDNDVYQYLAVFSFVIFAPTYFLSQIQSKSNEKGTETINYPYILKILGLYILLPLISIYTIILYGYLIKIVINWELPNGWVSWLVSILAVSIFVTIIIIHPLYEKKDNKIANYFTRYLPLLLIPLLILMFIGIIRRFSDYGITLNRLLIIILNIWFFAVAIYLIISKSHNPKVILISFSFVSLLSAIGPWSPIYITENKLKNEFQSLLKEINWNNSINYVNNNSLSLIKQYRIKDLAYYLQNNYGKNSIHYLFSALGKDADVYTLVDKLNIPDKNQNDKYFNLIISNDTNIKFDISEYKSVIRLAKNMENDTLYSDINTLVILENDKIKLKRDNNQDSISLIPLIMYNKENNKQNKVNIQDISLTGNDCKLIVLTNNGKKLNTGEVVIDAFEGLLFLK